MDLSHFSRPPCPRQGSPVGEMGVLVPPQPPMRRCRGCCSQTATGFDRALCSHAGVAVRGVAVRGRPCGRPSGTGVAEEPKLRRLVGRGRSSASLLSLARPARLRQRSECAARFSGAPGSEAESPRALGRMRVVLGRALRLKELLVSRHRSFLASAADPHRAEPATRCRGCSRVVSCSVYPVLSVCFAS